MELKKIEFELLTPQWLLNEDQTQFPYKYELEVQGITATDQANVIIEPECAAVALGAELCFISETANNKIIFRAKKIPLYSIKGICLII